MVLFPLRTIILASCPINIPEIGLGTALSFSFNWEVLVQLRDPIRDGSASCLRIGIDWSFQFRAAENSVMTSVHGTILFVEMFHETSSFHGRAGMAAMLGSTSNPPLN